MASFVETFMNDRGVSIEAPVGRKTKNNKKQTKQKQPAFGGKFFFFFFSLFHSILIFLSAIIFVFSRYYDIMA